MGARFEPLTFLYLLHYSRRREPLGHEKQTAALVSSFRSVHTNRPRDAGYASAGIIECFTQNRSLLTGIGGAAWKKGSPGEDGKFRGMVDWLSVRATLKNLLQSMRAQVRHRIPNPKP